MNVQGNDRPRKRGRSPAADCDDCLPISKRITRLQIESARRSTEEDHELPRPADNNCSAQNSPDVLTQPWQPNNNNCATNDEMASCPNLWNNHIEEQAHSSGNFTDPNSFLLSPHGKVRVDDMQGYNPDLKASANPVYYGINQLLYNAHMERTLRNRHSFKDS